MSAEAFPLYWPDGWPRTADWKRESDSKFGGTMPMMSHGGRPPSGEARSFEQAKKLFQEAFEKWKAALPPGQFEENLIYKRGHP